MTVFFFFKHKSRNTPGTCTYPITVVDLPVSFLFTRGCIEYTVIIIYNKSYRISRMTDENKFKDFKVSMQGNEITQVVIKIYI